jgi:hypothetical protein
MTCGHLFNGIGGFALAASWMGWENIFHCEIDPFCNKVMRKHFPLSIEQNNYEHSIPTGALLHRGKNNRPRDANRTVIQKIVRWRAYRMTLEQIKADLLYKSSLDAIVKGERDKKTTEGMRDVPVRKMIDAIQYIDKNLLPAVKKKGGDKSADVEFFEGVRDMLIWAILITDRYDVLEGKLVRKKIEAALYKEWMELYEKELTKYTTLEDLLLSDALNIYAQGIKNRVEALKNGRKLG